MPGRPAQEDEDSIFRGGDDGRNEIGIDEKPRVPGRQARPAAHGRFQAAERA